MINDEATVREAWFILCATSYRHNVIVSAAFAERDDPGQVRTEATGTQHPETTASTGTQHPELAALTDKGSLRRPEKGLLMMTNRRNGAMVRKTLLILCDTSYTLIVILPK